MFALTAAGSAVMLVWVIAIALGRDSKAYGYSILGAAVLFVLVGYCLMSPFLFINALVLVGTTVLCMAVKLRPRWFVAAATLATLSCYAFVAASNFAENARLRQRYPLESLTDRLAYEQQSGPAESPRSTGVAMATTAIETLPGNQLGYLETEIDKQERCWWSSDDDEESRNAGSRARTLVLERIHASYVRQFVESPGFGFPRAVPMTSTRALTSDEQNPPIPLPPAEYDDPIETEDAKGSVRPCPVSDLLPPILLVRFHYDSLLNFVYLRGFGYVRDREQVAGFRPHQFRYLPAPPKSDFWRVRSLDLVSLLKHPEPVAYVSPNLPRMDELRHAPTRELNPFERRALEALRRGEELQVAATRTVIRMLGAIRATTQCHRCHQVQHGELLGAFSYKLGPVVETQKK